MMNEVFLPKYAKQYDCGLVDVRGGWVKYMQEHGLEPPALLKDGVHLNKHGEWLMAQLISRYLVHRPVLNEGDKNLVRMINVGEDVEIEGSKLTVEFRGDRVDLLPSAPAQGQASKVRVLIDGKAPSEFPELYKFTRPSSTHDRIWPAIRFVQHEAPLVLEDWTLEVFDVKSNDDFKFRVAGSVTGPDGEGHSGEKFVSDSGRVVIDPEDWVFSRSAGLSKKNLKDGWVVRWKAIPQFVDVYEPPTSENFNPTLDNATTVANGLPKGEHTLELTAEGGSMPIKAIRVYEPPLKLE